MIFLKIKGGESKIGQGEPQTILSFGQLNGEFQNTDHSLEEAHTEKKWSGLTPTITQPLVGGCPGKIMALLLKIEADPRVLIFGGYKLTTYLTADRQILS